MGTGLIITSLRGVTLDHTFTTLTLKSNGKYDANITGPIPLYFANNPLASQPLTLYILFLLLVTQEVQVTLFTGKSMRLPANTGC